MSDETARNVMDATTKRLFPGEGCLDIAQFLGPLWPAAVRSGVAVEVISADAAALPVGVCAHTDRQALIAGDDIFQKGGVL